MNAAAEATAGQPLVLVVDDSPDYLRMLSQALQGTCRVRVANGGRRALELARQAPPDLVLLDVVMPELDGHAVLARLREDPRTSDVPVIFVSSMNETSDEVAGLALGAADFIAKPAPAALVQARVRMQLELKRTRDELSRRNAELEAFTYTVSHDLRAPLASIGGFAQALLEKEALGEQAQHRLVRISDCAQRMDRMIEDILACCRAERAQPRCVQVPLAELAADVIAELSPLYPAAHVCSEPLPMVQGDPVLLRQVLGNLVGNALKYSSRTPDPQVRIAAEVGDDAVTVRVNDNGAGFEPAYADRLFGLFQRLHTQAEFPGTGVGLAIVQRIVARHGGSVHAQSRAGGGDTTFSFCLPVQASSTCSR
jgi:signal transduction histidine kinase